jgi:hypothetical protein
VLVGSCPELDLATGHQEGGNIGQVCVQYAVYGVLEHAWLLTAGKLTWSMTYGACVHSSGLPHMVVTYELVQYDSCTPARCGHIGLESRGALLVATYGGVSVVA